MRDKEKFRKVQILRDSGLTFVEIGKQLGISPSYAGSMYQRQVQHDNFQNEKLRLYQPEWHEGLSEESVRKLKYVGVKNKSDCMKLTIDGLEIKWKSVNLPVSDSLEYPGFKENIFGEVVFNKNAGRLPIYVVNEVRKWLGFSEISIDKTVSESEILRAITLLESNGYIVSKPRRARRSD